MGNYLVGWIDGIKTPVFSAGQNGDVGKIAEAPCDILILSCSVCTVPDTLLPILIIEMPSVSSFDTGIERLAQFPSKLFFSLFRQG